MVAEFFLVEELPMVVFICQLLKHVLDILLGLFDVLFRVDVGLRLFFFLEALDKPNVVVPSVGDCSLHSFPDVLESVLLLCIQFFIGVVDDEIYFGVAQECDQVGRVEIFRLIIELLLGIYQLLPA